MAEQPINIECILSSNTYFSMQTCIPPLIRFSKKGRELIIKNFPNLLINGEQVSKEALEKYRELSRKTVNLNNKNNIITPHSKNKKNIDNRVVKAPDWFAPVNNEYEPYHVFINDINGTIVDVKIKDKKIKIKNDIEFNKYSHIPSEILNIANGHLKSGVIQNSTIKLKNGIFLGTSLSKTSLNINLIDTNNKEKYSYGLETGLVHWQQMTASYSSTKYLEDYNFNYRAKDSYKNRLGMFNTEYSYSTINNFSMDNFTYLLKPFSPNLQLAASWAQNLNYSAPSGTVSNPYMQVGGEFRGIDIYNFSIFDHEYTINQSTSKFQVFSKGYAFAKIYSNGLYIESVELSPGFNKLTDRLLPPGSNSIKIEKKYNDGNIDIDFIDYFKKSMKKPTKNGTYSKLSIGQQKINNYFTNHLSASITSNNFLGVLSANALYLPDYNATSIELSYESDFKFGSSSIYGLASNKNEYGLGARVSIRPFNGLYANGSYRQVFSNDCQKQLTLINRGCSQDLNYIVGSSLPYGLHLTYNFRKSKANQFINSDTKHKSHRFSLTRNTAIANRLILGFSASYEQAKNESFNRILKTKDFYIGINLSYFIDKYSTSLSSSLQGDNISSNIENSINIGYNNDRVNLNARLNSSQSDSASNSYSGAVTSSYRGDIGALYLNSSFSENLLETNIGHESTFAINDKSFSLKSNNSLFSDTGVIIDTGVELNPRDLNLSIRSSTINFNQTISTNDQKFIALRPGEYLLSFNDSRENINELTSLHINQRKIKLFKGDIKTINFTKTNNKLISFNHDFGDISLIKISGCKLNFSLQNEHEFTCYHNPILNKSINILLNNKEKQCKIEKIVNHKDIFLSLQGLNCEQKH